MTFCSKSLLYVVHLTPYRSSIVAYVFCFTRLLCCACSAPCLASIVFAALALQRSACNVHAHPYFAMLVCLSLALVISLRHSHLGEQKLLNASLNSFASLFLMSPCLSICPHVLQVTGFLGVMHDIEHASRQAYVIDVKKLRARHHIVMQFFALLALEDLSASELVLKEQIPSCAS